MVLVVLVALVDHVALATLCDSCDSFSCGFVVLVVLEAIVVHVMLDPTNSPGPETNVHNCPPMGEDWKDVASLQTIMLGDLTRVFLE